MLLSPIRFLRSDQLILLTLSVYLAIAVSAKPPWTDMNIATLPSEEGFTIMGGIPSGALGSSISSAGDINKDGFSDIIIGTPGVTGGSNVGAAYVVFGKSARPSSNIDLGSTSLSTSQQGFKISGASASDYLGYSVSNAGDVNNDGFDDIIIGAWGASLLNTGAAYIIFGKHTGFSDIDLSTISLSSSHLGYQISGEATGDKFGFSVSNAGDVNKDGIDDLVIGAAYKGSQNGAAYVIFGSSSPPADIALSIINLSSSGRGFKITGAPPHSRFGASVNHAGDVNNDGFNDIIIGAPASSSSLGSAYIIFGKKGLQTDIDLSNTDLLSLGRGFKITGATTGDYFGSSVNSAGDINNDGVDDMVIGAPKTAGTTGTAYIVFGRSNALSNIDLSTTDLSTSQLGFKISFPFGDHYFGASVSKAGDLNNDGIDDLIIGAEIESSNTGAAYIVYGRRDGFTDIDLSITILSTSQQGFKITGASSGDQFGHSVTNIGDLDYDGSVDFLVGAHKALLLAGAAYIVYGKDVSVVISEVHNVGLENAMTATTISHDVANAVGGFLCIGSSIPLRSGLISKLIEDIRLLKVEYSSELQNIFQTRRKYFPNTHLPTQVNSKIVSKDIDPTFTRYGFKASFLSNFWRMTVLIFTAFAFWAICQVFVFLFKCSDKECTKLFSNVLVKASKAALNFLITQLYGSLGDVVFFSVLEIKSAIFDSTWSNVSFA